MRPPHTPNVNPVARPSNNAHNSILLQVLRVHSCQEQHRRTVRAPRVDSVSLSTSLTADALLHQRCGSCRRLLALLVSYSPLAMPARLNTGFHLPLPRSTSECWGL